MSGPELTLPPDLVGFEAAVESQDDEINYTYSAIRDTIYGALAANATALNLLERVARRLANREGAGLNLARKYLDQAIEQIDEAVHLGYAFAEGDFDDVAEARGIDQVDAVYDGFVNQRMEHATEEDDDEDR